MGRFHEFIARVAELLIEPNDWQVEHSGNSTTFKGEFLVYDRTGRTRLRVSGQIVEWYGLPTQVFIYDPPIFVKDHPHGRCLQLLRPNDRWFKLHFEKPARNFPDAYTYVEHFLTEAYNSQLWRL